MLGVCLQGGAVVTAVGAGLLVAAPALLFRTSSSIRRFGVSFVVGRSGATEREKNLQAIVHVNMALSTATGCITLHEQKVSLLATLRRWREVASHCERFAAANAKFDGCFTEDLAPKHRFMGVALRPGTWLMTSLETPEKMRLVAPK
jgi:hypothetical protein